MPNFSQRLAEAISVSGKPKGSLAAHTGVALSTVSRWLGGSVPKAETVDKIAKFLGVDAKWLITGEPKPLSMAELLPLLNMASFERGRDRRAKELAMESEQAYCERTSHFGQLARSIFNNSRDLCAILTKGDDFPPEIKAMAAVLQDQLEGEGMEIGRIITEAQVLRRLAESSPAMLRILREPSAAK